LNRIDEFPNSKLLVHFIARAEGKLPLVEIFWPGEWNCLGLFFSGGSRELPKHCYFASQ